ncbi:MAG: TRAP transporter substrate-binding protein DctP [Arenicella sp.]
MFERFINQYRKTFWCCVLLTALSVPLRASADSNSPVLINFFVDDDKDSVVRAMGNRFKELVAKQIGAKVQVNIHGLGDRDLFEEMRVGNTQMIAPKLSRLKRYSRRLQVFELPFIFYSEKAARNFLDGEWGKRLLISLKNKGVNAHGYIHQGMKHLTSDVEILTPNDASGKAMGIFYSNTSKQYFENIGSEIVSLNDTEENSALSNNRVNITENNWGRVYNQKLYGQHEYVLESNHTYTGNVLITSKDIWEEMPAQLVPVLEKIIKESIEYGNDYARKRNERYRQAVVNTGSNTVHELAARDRYLWIEAASYIWSLYEDEIGSQLIDAAASHR